VFHAATKTAAAALGVQSAGVVRAGLGQVAGLMTYEAGCKLKGLLPLLFGPAISSTDVKI